MYNKRCLSEMPETFEFSVDAKIPLNDKWDLAKIKAGKPEADWATSVQNLENKLEWETVFYFTHDRSVEEANRKFAENVQSGGDVDQNGDLWKFFGAMDYRGSGGSLVVVRGAGRSVAMVVVVVVVVVGRGGEVEPGVENDLSNDLFNDFSLSLSLSLSLPPRQPG